MKMYEYKLLTMQGKDLFGGMADPEKPESELNELGAKGWEIVSALASSGVSGITHIVSVFKREVQQ